MLATLGMSASTPADAGVISGLFNTTQQIGAAVGVALLSTLAASHSGQLHHQGVALPAALTSGYRLAFGVGAGLSAASFIVAAVLLRPRPARPAPAQSTPAQAEAIMITEPGQ
jgi:MFS family permease